MFCGRRSLKNTKLSIKRFISLLLEIRFNVVVVQGMGRAATDKFMYLIILNYKIFYPDLIAATLQYYFLILPGEPIYNGLITRFLLLIPLNAG